MAEQDRPDFGSNSWIVEELYHDYLDDPSSVGESWREFFADYRPVAANGATATRTQVQQAPTAPGNGNGSARPAAPARPAQRPPQPQSTPDQAAPAPGTSAPGTSAPAASAPAPSPQQPAAPKGPAAPSDGATTRLRGGAAILAANMAQSLEVPTATSLRVVPAKLLEVNRRILNNQLQRTRGGKVSFTHLIGWAIVRAMDAMPVMTSSYAEVDGKPSVHRPEHVNLGLAVDVERPDGGRTLLVPNIKQVDTLDFAGFYTAYEQVIRKVKRNQLTPDLFEATTATLTNPGTVGTIASVPRLMQGQSVIVGTGAIDYPAEYQGADPRTLAAVGVGKVLTVTSTYDHRVIQGAESGLFLKTIHELLMGAHDFYDEVFSSLQIPYAPVYWHADEAGPASGAGAQVDPEKQIAVGRLINAYRVRGHLIANTNPLREDFTSVHPELDPATYGLTIWDLDREFFTAGLAKTSVMRLGDILGVLRDAYCRTVGVEYMFISEPEQKAWIQSRVEGAKTSLPVEQQRHVLGRLNAAEAFEKFLHTKYIGHKRFSLEGAESTVPMIDALLSAAADDGITDAVLGMAHRGRLNMLANVLGKSLEKIFSEFEGDVDPGSVQGSGDVKYHLGAEGAHTSPSGNRIALTLSSNPSHLEAVDPVVEGMARAKLDAIGTDGSSWPVLPVLLHGDAAFAGQGVVAETFAMSQLRGYRTGGTVHLVINNQVGFTTGPEASRSSTYATDVAKVVQAPIFHVNGDDPEACVRVMRLALEFRQAFAKDVVVDLLCYRRWGHNEGDDPSYTQPLMYAAIEEHRSVRKRYVEELVARGDLTVDEAEHALDDFRSRLESALSQTRESAPPKLTEVPPRPSPAGVLEHVETGVARKILDEILDGITRAPEGFAVHPKLAKQLERRREQLRRDEVDWATGEALAFGSLALEGHPVRLSGQDSRRGTFSQRHSVLVDHRTGADHVPLHNLRDGQAPFLSYDSLLSEYAAMGFEYGYSVLRPDALTLWEGQFGDFVNGAQIVVDQFLVAAEQKWRQRSGLVLLLPHGYEGQGPEHSSARIERFLTLCAEDNIQVVQPTTSAQYFHVLRRQLHRDVRKPLVVITPKGLLRAKPATSPADAFSSGSFSEVLGVPGDPSDVQRVLLCSGRVAYDLAKARDDRGAPVSVVRVEQLYPWPEQQIRDVIAAHPGVTEATWVQDEPENMGPWSFVHGRLHRLLGEGDVRLRHVARAESASPATGSATVHEAEQADLMDRAFAGLA